MASERRLIAATKSGSGASKINGEEAAWRRRRNQRSNNGVMKIGVSKRNVMA